MDAVPVKWVPRGYGQTYRRDAWWVEPLVVFLILGSLQFSEASLRVYGHPGLLGVAAAINGPDFTPFNEALWIKEPGTAKRTAWHQDQPYFCVDGAQMCSIWLPVDPVDELPGLVELERAARFWPSAGTCRNVRGPRRCDARMVISPWRRSP